MKNLWSFIMISATLLSFSRTNRLKYCSNGPCLEKGNAWVQKPDCRNSIEVLLKNKINVMFCYKTVIKETESQPFADDFSFESQVDILTERYLLSKTKYDRNAKEILFVQFDAKGNVILKETTTYYKNQSIKRGKRFDPTTVKQTFFEKKALPINNPKRLSATVYWVDETYYDNNLLETCSDVRMISSHSGNVYDVYEFLYQ